VRSIEKGEYIEPSKMTLETWLDKWLETYTSDIKKSTHANYAGKVKYRIKPALGKVKLSELNRDNIQNFINDLGKNSKLPYPCSQKHQEYTRHFKQGT